MAGDTETGITIMRVVLALDAGPTLAEMRMAIEPNDTSVEVERRLAAGGARLLARTVDALAVGPVPETPQDESGVTYARRIERGDSQVDWSRPARQIHDQIRGLHPWPLAAALLGSDRIRLLESRLPADAQTSVVLDPGTIIDVRPEFLVLATGDGVVHVTRVQPEGRAAMAVRDFVNGRRVTKGERFSPVPPP
jgi:methionyl-tRNA formyltransferase